MPESPQTWLDVRWASSAHAAKPWGCPNRIPRRRRLSQACGRRLPQIEPGRRDIKCTRQSPGVVDAGCCSSRLKSWVSSGCGAVYRGVGPWRGSSTPLDHLAGSTWGTTPPCRAARQAASLGARPGARAGATAGVLRVLLQPRHRTPKLRTRRPPRWYPDRGEPQPASRRCCWRHQGARAAAPPCCARGR